MSGPKLKVGEVDAVEVVVEEPVQYGVQELLKLVPRGDVMAGAVMAGAVIAEMRSMIVIVRGGSGCRERWPSWSWV